MAATRFVITGLVQGVGFRWFAARTARSLGVAGSVRNAVDGGVEVVASATDAALDAFAVALARGPHGSRVDSVVRTREPESAARLPDPFEIVS